MSRKVTKATSFLEIYLELGPNYILRRKYRKEFFVNLVKEIKRETKNMKRSMKHREEMVGKVRVQFMTLESYLSKSQKFQKSRNQLFSELFST